MSMQGFYFLGSHAFTYLEQKLLKPNQVGPAGGKRTFLISQYGFKSHVYFLIESEMENAEFGSQHD